MPCKTVISTLTTEPYHFTDFLLHTIVFHHISLMLSPHPADPTLTTDNLMEVVREVKHLWKDLGRKLGVDTYRFSVRGMADVVDEYVRRYPTPSWKKVATALQEMKLDKLADEVTTKYVRGTDVNHVTCLIQKLKLYS